MSKKNNMDGHGCVLERIQPVGDIQAICLEHSNVLL